MARSYVSARRDMAYARSRSTLLIICILLIFATASFFTVTTHNRLRENLIEKLNQDKQITETNNMLKSELAGITQTRFLELKARERLGLKKPKDEEVLVLR
ncbi:MAG TPA: hypothetical protein VMT62_14985 [Syntrophorhabdaceae bacterium]|nr:hypothetical protein [Syntrophorhabdaceae bacterium]